jgi:DNA repair exonuclease SbcCD ATPase subunit
MIKYIFQISDLCIFRRSYINIIHAIGNLIEQINKFPKGEILLVIAGNVFEYRVKVSAYDIQVFHGICGRLSKNKIPTVIVPGIHDIGESSILMALLSNGGYKNIFLFSKSGWHSPNLGNIIFSVFSPNCSKYHILPPKGKEQYLKIAVVSFDIPKTNSVFNRQGPYVYLASKFDLVMVGGHISRGFSKSNKNIAGSGTFVQKDRTDGLIHGFIFWNLHDNSKSKFISIPQKELYVNLQAVSEECKFPNVNARYVSIEYAKCSSGYISSLARRAKIKYGRKVDLITDIDTIMNRSAKKTIAAELPTVQEILTKAGEDQQIIESVMKLHNGFSSKIAPRIKSPWMLKYLMWNNVMCYGANNFVHFGECKGLSSIVGNNRSGKSTVLDIVILILFDIYVRGNKNFIINSGAETASIKCLITSSHDTYIIERIFGNTGKNQRCVLTKNGTVVLDKSNRDIPEVYSMLKSVVGTYQDFICTSGALQNRPFLVDISPSERLNYVCYFLGIDKLEQIEKLVKSDIRACRSQERVINVRPESDFINKHMELEEAKTELILINERILLENKAFSDTTLRKSNILESLDKEIDIDEYPKFKKRYDLVKDVPISNFSLKMFIFEIEKLSEKISKIRTEVLHLPDIKNPVFISKSHILAINNHVGDLETLRQVKETELSDNKELIKQYTKEITALEKNILNTNTSVFVFSDSCESCRNNKASILLDSTKELRESISDLTLDIDNFTIDNVEIDKFIKSIDAYIENHTISVNLTNRANLEKSLEIEGDNLEKLKDSVSIHEDYINKEHMSKTRDKYIKNIELRKTLVVVNANLVNIENNQKVLKKKYRLALAKIEKIRAEINEWRNMKTIRKGILHKKRILELYLSCINRKTGIPSMAISTICQSINTQCNMLLKNMTDFIIEFRFEKNINIFIHENDKKEIPATVGSGFQKFIVDLVLRICFLTISEVSNPRILFIDEGFGTIDENNLTEVIRCLTISSKLFESVVIITHMPEMRAVCDNIIEVVPKRGYSLIRHGTIPDMIRRISISKKFINEGKRARKPKESFDDPDDELISVEVFTPENLHINQKTIRKTAGKATSEEKEDIIQKLEEKLSNDDMFNDLGDMRIQCSICDKDYNNTPKVIERHLKTKLHRNNLFKYSKNIQIV